MNEQKMAKTVERMREGRAGSEERAALVSAVAGSLADEQRTVVESDPYAPFKFKLPNYGRISGALSEAERDSVISRERDAHTRAVAIAREKAAQPSAWLASGGDASSFEARWKGGGREAFIAQRADDLRSQATSVFD